MSTVAEIFNYMTPVMETFNYMTSVINFQIR